MNFNSIRWRLPLSYAGIALLAALSLGLVLVATLRGYYTEQERHYLVMNAGKAESALAALLEANAPAEVLQVQVDNLAFVTQTRLRLYDREQKLLVESSDPARQDILTFSPLPFTFAVRLAEPAAPPPPGDRPSLRIENFEAGPRLFNSLTDGPAGPTFGTIFVYRNITPTQEITGSLPVTGAYGIISSIPASLPANTLYFADEAGMRGRRSSQSFRMALRDRTGKPLGSLELSQGPAYGWPILSSVTRAWLGASAIAVLLAALVGWFASRRVTAPLTALADVTARMAQGELSARARADSQDEFGALGRSFNGMAARIEETVLTLRQFASDAAHELQTPLTALRTSLELSAEEADAARQSVYLVRAQEQVKRLSLLAEDLLDLSRLEAGLGAEAPSPVDLSALLSRVSETYAARAEQSGLEFHLSISPGETIVLGNEIQLERLVGNLLDNAVKFTPAPGSVSSGLDAKGDEARLWVEDSGIGIPAEDMAHLFSRFHRGRNTANYPGSGLGLAMVEAIARVHGGRAISENLPGGGARFTVFLPLDRRDS